MTKRELTRSQYSHILFWATAGVVIFCLGGGFVFGGLVKHYPILLVLGAFIILVGSAIFALSIRQVRGGFRISNGR